MMSVLPRSHPPRYGVAVLAAALALGARALLDVPRGADAPFVLAYPAVALAAWYGGLGPGLVATALSAAGVVALLELAVLPALVAPDLMGFSLFVVSGVLTSGLCELLHRERRRVELHNQER